MKEESQSDETPDSEERTEKVVKTLANRFLNQMKLSTCMEICMNHCIAEAEEKVGQLNDEGLSKLEEALFGERKG